MGRMRRTIHGYDPMEIISAFQKDIRRGNEENALYWAAELFRSNYGGWAWSRILTIVSEDIGPAESGLAADVWALFQTYEWMVKRKKDAEKNVPHASRKAGKLPLVHAVMILCRALKSREVDHANGWFFTDYPDRLDIPDYAYDMHTAKGKSMGRGLDHFMDEGCQLKNSVHEDPPGVMGFAKPDPYEERFRLARGKDKPPINNPPVGDYAGSLSMFDVLDDEEEE